MPRTNKKCQFPGCEEFIYSRTGKYCQTHKGMKPYRTLAAKARISELQRQKSKKTSDRYMTDHITGICARCDALTICRTEIRRPDWWPPCTPSSRFFDQSLVGEKYASLVEAG